MSTRASTQRSVRTKKLSTKAHLQIYRENELDGTFEEVGQGVAKEKVETGVEKGEESVSSHLFSESRALSLLLLP